MTVCRTHHLTSQKGVALLSMLLVFTLVVVLAAGVVTRTGFDIRRTDQQLQRSQAWQYALGAEAQARQILHRDWQQDQQNNGSDNLSEAWAQPQQFAPDDGEMRMVIEDLQGRFNLNGLVNAGGNANAEQLQRWQRLLHQLHISTNGRALVDWLDSNSIPTDINSEDSFFLAQSPAYRSADQPLASEQELRLLQLFSESQLREILPRVAALPAGTIATNPNTASAEVIASVNDQLDGAAIVAARSAHDGFRSVGEFLQHPLTAGIELDPQAFTVRSEYFLVWIVARYREQQVYLQSLLHRDASSGALHLAWRNRQPPDSYLNPFLNTTNYQASLSGVYRPGDQPQ